uniref:Uncharacterized protein n=2 Tax=Caenorhabditis japonica TaxID=281687 RepID=A0A8R1HUL2_CAEJA
MGLQFERQMISKALLDFKWTKHIAMGCDETGKGHRDNISALDIDDGDQMLLLASHSGSISIAKYKYLGRRKWKKPMNINLKRQALQRIRWCPLDLRLFMLSTASGWLRVCDSTMEKEIHGKQFEGDVYFDWNEYNTVNSKVIVADGSQSMKIIDFRVGMNLPLNIRWDEQCVDVVQWYPSKQHYLYAGRRDGTIGVFDIRSTRGVIASKKIHNYPMYGLRISSDGLRVISSDRSGHIHVADTWDFSKKGEFRGEYPIVCHRNPDLEVMGDRDTDVYVAANFRKLAVLRFTGDSKIPSCREVEERSLAERPVIFRKSSYELITGFIYNYLNILSLDRAPKEEDEKEEE